MGLYKVKIWSERLVEAESEEEAVMALLKDLEIDTKFASTSDIEVQGVISKDGIASQTGK